MNPFEGVRVFEASVQGTTAIVKINLFQYPQVAIKEAIDAGMAFYVEKHHPNIHRWEARSDGRVLTLFVTGNIDFAAVMRMR
jgi:hypothetical protein